MCYNLPALLAIICQTCLFLTCQIADATPISWVQASVAFSRNNLDGRPTLFVLDYCTSPYHCGQQPAREYAHRDEICMKATNHLSVYFLSGCKAGTTFEYRVLQKQEQLALYGFQSVAQQNLSYNKETLSSALSSDLLYLYRVAYSPLVEELIQQARACRIPVIFGIDDLVFEPGVVNDPVKDMPHDQAALYYEGTWRFRQTLLACDYVVAATEYLAELARGYGRPAFVHRNGLSQWMVDAAERLTQQQREQPKGDTIIIGYSSGTDTHNQDFREASPAMAQIMARYPQVELHILGPLIVPPDLRSFGERVRNLPLMPWKEVFGILNTFDINLGPLERGNPFCHAKSEVKYIEAAPLGIPTVASRIDPFEFAIRDGENGFLAGDTEEWVEKLEQLVTDPDLRCRIGKDARADVMAHYTPAALGQKLVQTLETIQEHYTQERASTLYATAAPRETPLTLNWIVTEPTPGSGGHTDIIRMINLLASFGHQVNVYVVPIQRLVDKSDLEIRDFVRRHFADLDGFVFKWTGGPMVESDALIVTHWTTAYEIDSVRNTSKVFYFVQDWEPFFCPMGTDYLRAEQTYRMGFSCITLGRWLTEHLRERYGADADYFDLAVNHAIYYPRPVDKPDRPRVCFYARPSTPRRLFPIGAEALGLVHQRRPDVEVVFYGCRDHDLYPHEITFPYTNRGILKEQELAELFSSSEVGVVLSSTNCSLVPPEMMACRCAIVDLDRETVHGVLEHETNALLAEPTPQAIADAVVRLLDDEPLRQRLIETAYQQVQQLSWATSARRVEEILVKKLPTSRRGLSPYRFDVQPSPPALTDLPPEQREHLDAIHRKRRRVSARLIAVAKRMVKFLLRIDRGRSLGDAPVQVLGELTGKRCIGQSFVVQRDDLHRVDVLVSTYGRRNTRDVVFHLRESPSTNDDLATVRLNASMLADCAYARFVFQPQSGSRGKTFYFCLESPESVPGDAITLWAYHRADLLDAKVYRNGRPRGGQLVFGTFYLDDELGEVGERPFPHRLGRITSLWQRLKKAYQLLSSHSLSELKWEVLKYLEWKISKA